MKRSWITTNTNDEIAPAKPPENIPRFADTRQIDYIMLPNGFLVMPSSASGIDRGLYTVSGRLLVRRWTEDCTFYCTLP